MTTIYHQRAGNGPALLLLHATLSSSRQLHTLAGTLATRFTVVSVDRRGSGRSATHGSARPIDVATHVRDLLDIVQAEQLPPALLVGHSYGACVALELAARHPEVVSALFAFEPPYGPLAPPASQAYMAQIAREALAANARGDLEGAALAFMAGVSGTEAVAALSPAARARIGRAGQGAVADATLLGMNADGLTAIDAPVRIASGSASDPLYVDIAEALVGRIRAASHRRLEGLGHMAPISQPHVIAESVIDFARGLGIVGEGSGR